MKKWEGKDVYQRGGYYEKLGYGKGGGTRWWVGGKPTR